MMEARQSRAKPLGNRTPTWSPIYVAIENGVPEEMSWDDITIFPSLSRGIVKLGPFSGGPLNVRLTLGPKSTFHMI
jgi:hypothetical protein